MEASPFLALPAFLPLLSLLPLLFPHNAFSGVVAADADGFFGDLLRSYGLPAGLLPKPVNSFALDPASDLLEVRLCRPCYARYDGGGLAYFDSIVSGNLSYGALGGVVRWSQEELFLRLPVKAILVDDPGSGVILFDIGLALKQLSASVFEDPPDAVVFKMAGKELHARRGNFDMCSYCSHPTHGSGVRGQGSEVRGLTRGAQVAPPDWGGSNVWQGRNFLAGGEMDSSSVGND